MKRLRRVNFVAPLLEVEIGLANPISTNCRVSIFYFIFVLVLRSTIIVTYRPFAIFYLIRHRSFVCEKLGGQTPRTCFKLGNDWLLYKYMLPLVDALWASRQLHGIWVSRFIIWFTVFVWASTSVPKHSLIFSCDIESVLRCFTFRVDISPATSTSMGRHVFHYTSLV